jgi:hypothetical protein
VGSACCTHPKHLYKKKKKKKKKKKEKECTPELSMASKSFHAILRANKDRGKTIASQCIARQRRLAEETCRSILKLSFQGIPWQHQDH